MSTILNRNFVTAVPAVVFEYLRRIDKVPRLYVPVPLRLSVKLPVARTRFGAEVDATHGSVNPGVTISQFVRFIGAPRFSGAGDPSNAPSPVCVPAVSTL